MKRKRRRKRKRKKGRRKSAKKKTGRRRERRKKGKIDQGEMKLILMVLMSRTMVRKIRKEIKKRNIRDATMTRMMLALKGMIKMMLRNLGDIPVIARNLGRYNICYSIQNKLNTGDVALTIAHTTCCVKPTNTSFTVAWL